MRYPVLQYTGQPIKPISIVSLELHLNMLLIVPLYILLISIEYSVKYQCPIHVDRTAFVYYSWETPPLTL